MNARLKSYASLLGRARDAIRRRSAKVRKPGGRKRNRRAGMEHLDFELFRNDLRV